MHVTYMAVALLHLSQISEDAPHHGIGSNCVSFVHAVYMRVYFDLLNTFLWPTINTKINTN